MILPSANSLLPEVPLEQPRKALAVAGFAVLMPGQHLRPQPPHIVKIVITDWAAAGNWLDPQRSLHCSKHYPYHF